MNSYLYQHRNKLLSIFCMLMILLSLNWVNGDFVGFEEVGVLDAAGEGGFVLIVLAWLVFMLSCRPDGTVTRLLFFGACGPLLSTSQDFIDEFFKVQPVWAFDMLESVPAIIGISVYCFGLSRWAEEQRLLNLQLQKQEKFYRKHTSLDFATGLYNARYMQEQLRRELSFGRPCALLMIEIERFKHINARYGDEESNQLLRHIAQVLQLGMRQYDLLCRYDNRHFVALLSECDSALANSLAQDMLTSSRTIGYRHSETQQTIDVSVRIGLATSKRIDEVDAVLKRAINALDQAGDNTVRDAA